MNAREQVAGDWLLEHGFTDDEVRKMMRGLRAVELRGTAVIFDQTEDGRYLQISVMAADNGVDGETVMTNGFVRVRRKL